MSIAYSKRKKAIRRGTWDFSAQTRRQAWQYFRHLTADERQTEIERFVKPPTIVELGYPRLRLPSFGGKYVP